MGTHADTPQPSADRSRFGEIAQDLGLLSDNQVREVLCQQQAHQDSGQPRLKIGEMLNARHILELRAIQKILLEQQRRRHTGPRKEAARSGNIGQFEILAVLGTGGMGTVYKVRDKALNRIVALKVLAPRLSEDAEFVARFQREVKAAGCLSHPNIISALGSGSESGQPYIIMEYAEGQSLGRLLKRNGRLEEKEALRIALAVARALSHAHEAGIVHRDVKPDNVLLTPDGGIKLTDFGLARLMRDDHRLTQTGVAVGTPHYISPEQVAGSRYIDHRADQYSLGAMLFHMLTGQVPFDGPANNDVMLRHVEEPVRDPRELAPGVTPAAASLVLKMMAKKAADRCDLTSQLAEDMERVLKGQPPRYAPAAPQSHRPARRGAGCAALFLLPIAVASLAIWYKNL